ncbi:acetolactate synthase 3 large subunit [Okibacterium endophyticum]
MNRIPAGQAIVNALVAEGTEYVFGMPGGHVLGIYDAIHTTEGIRSILVRHEHTAASMAAAHAQLTGQPGIVLVTAGPGVTNTLTAVAEAFVGALPMIVLAGRGSTATAYRGASQEIPTDRVFAPITKWSTRVDRAELLADVMRQAFSIARSGKPGPVLIDIPRDLLTESVSDKQYIPVGKPARIRPDRDAIRRAATALEAAERPIIVSGGGAIGSEASEAVRSLAEKIAAPVITSLAGRGIVPEDHLLAVGGLGAHRNPVSKRLLQEADVVLGLGTRFEEMETNWQPGALPAATATYIQVDIDPTELGKSTPAAIPIVGDIRATVEDLLAVLNTPEKTILQRQKDIHPRMQAELASLEREISAMADDDSLPINPVRVIRAAREVFPRDTILGVDVGALAQHIGGAFPYFPVFEARSTIVPSSFYGMGFVSAALPAARLAHPSRPALCFVGDGSFQMSMSALPVAADYGLPVTWCVLNDGALGSIWDIQHHSFENRIVDTEFGFQPDFAALAASCGCYGEQVMDPQGVTAALERALEANNNGTPAVLDFSVARLRLPQTKEHYFTTFPQEHAPQENTQ